MAFGDRGPTNLLAPDREGEGWELGASLAFRLRSTLEIVGRGTTEWGRTSDWRESHAFAALRVLF